MLIKKRSASVRVFHSLHLKTFDDNIEFIQTIVKVFNKYQAYFPPHYTYENLVRWGEKKGWVIRLKLEEEERRWIVCPGTYGLTVIFCP